MSETKIEKEITTVSTVRHVVGRKDLLEWARYHVSEAIPDNAEIFIHVPGGGDWSNMDLDVGGDTPIEITYRTFETETKES